jgi:DNA-binding transcriptional LysR family regulator
MARPSLNELTAFVSVATHRSFRRAADQLDMAPSTLSHAVRALEDGLGVRLLHRTTRSVSPTEAGFRLLERLGPALEGLDEALESVVAFRGRVAGAVRINAPRVAVRVLVRDVLPSIAERFPDVTVDIVAEDRLVDIVAGGFDAGVRPVEMIPRDMIAVPLPGALRYVCVASPAYLSRAGSPGTPEELKDHRCIGHRLPSGKLYQWEFERSGQALTLKLAGAVVLDDEDVMVEAAARGLGVAYVPEPAAAAALAAGHVQAVLSDWTHAPESVAIYYPGHRAVPPPLRAVLEVLRELDRTRGRPEAQP